MTDQELLAAIRHLPVPVELRKSILYAVMDPNSWNTSAYNALLELIEHLTKEQK